ncbi:glycosyl transferase family protein [Calothrix sp. NIES-4071]|nr:glycosyl transferase family protein [Calothrix sp. NIES-4071]BAZ62539.1 glycosyl transferase family protein [Calothrix sp. NIES-4105]
MRNGAKTILKKPFNKSIINQSALIEFSEDDFTIEAKVIRYQVKKKYLHIVVNFQNVSLMQNRCLVEMLYCNLNWWKQRKKPGFTDSFLALMTATLTLRPVSNSYK